MRRSLRLAVGHASAFADVVERALARGEPGKPIEIHPALAREHLECLRQLLRAVPMTEAEPRS